MSLVITRRDLTSEELRGEARMSQDVSQARRCLAIALVLDGRTRTQAAEAAGMQRQTLRDWVHRYNAGGVAALLNRAAPARPDRLSPEQLAAFGNCPGTSGIANPLKNKGTVGSPSRKNNQDRLILIDGSRKIIAFSIGWGTWAVTAFDQIVEKGPNVETDGVVRWRRIDLKGVVEHYFGVVLAERTIGDLLHARGFRHLSVRPRHRRCDEAAQETFKKTLPRRPPP